MSSLTLLLLLKAYLKNSYGLTDAKCLAFAPAGKPEKTFAKPPDVIPFGEISSPFLRVIVDPTPAQLKGQFEQVIIVTIFTISKHIIYQ
jgi:hypothetical protein